MRLKNDLKLIINFKFIFYFFFLFSFSHIKFVEIIELFMM